MYNKNYKTISQTTLRALADSIAKTAGRLEDPDLYEDKVLLNQASGLLIELANKFTRTRITDSVPIQTFVPQNEDTNTSNQ
ncbi:MAG TPA: hypothetical protein ENI76_07835 [Ignavibacteria bacterium]|nr:hypothetical protein [Ignavibacteria bacterium]